VGQACAPGGSGEEWLPSPALLALWPHVSET
jgi:hypothetical protein